jgi:hypothetical protein
MAISSSGELRKFSFNLKEMRYPSDTEIPAFCRALANETSVVELRWRSPA